MRHVLPLNRPRRLDFGATAGPPDQLVRGDSAVTCARVPDAALDAIYIDPPFGTGTVRRGRGAAYRDVADDPTAFVAWLRPWLEHSHRALRRHGSLFVHLDHRAVHYIKVELDRIFGRARFVNEIVWCYAVGGKSRHGFGRKHDTILWYARSADWAFYPDAVRVPRRAGSHMRVERDDAGQAVQVKRDRKTGKIYRYPIADGKVPEDWWTTSRRSTTPTASAPAGRPRSLSAWSSACWPR